jgi:primosomal protein N' (replication factor Y)
MTAATPKIARVAVARPLRTLFDYTVPTDTPAPRPGARVRVPFGRGECTGICVELAATSANAGELKALHKVLDAEPLLPTDLLQLVQWAADYYQHPIGDALFTALPGYLRTDRDPRALYETWWQACQGDDLAPPPRARKQRAAYDYLSRYGPAAQETLARAGFDSRVLNALAARGAARAYAEMSAPSLTIQPSPLVPAPEQATAIAAIDAARHTFRAFLLHGITGSGKTEVYLQAIAAALKRGEQALVLVPEISLTPQTVARFEARFNRVAAYHSGLSELDRARTWEACRTGRVRVLIGTRSAIFVPFADLGIIAVDEEHDGSFKQQDGFRYSARDLAAKRAHDLGIPVVFGTATPALETLHNARNGRYVHLRLNQRTGSAPAPRFSLVDLRGQTLTEGLSATLLDAIRGHVQAGNQALVFINRRGYAPSLLCTRCGASASCRGCEIPFTVHQHPPGLRCHHCNARAPMPNTCAECGADTLRPVGFGTQRAEAALNDVFADVPVVRIDRDTTRSQAHLAARLDEIHRNEPIILVGTQMLAKGHHFPRVTLVGVLNADAGFASPDFRAPEHTAQLIEQVAGRAGRAERAGEVIIQTYNPDHPLLRALIEQGYDGFAATEIEHRQAARLPPFRALALLRAEASIERAALDCLTGLLAPVAGTPALEVWGPVPAPMARRAGRFRAQAALLASDRGRLARALATVTASAVDSRTRAVRWSVDVDPYDMV